MGIIDVVAVLPTWAALFFPALHALIDVRLLRLLRLFRILNLAEYVEEYGALGRALMASRRKVLPTASSAPSSSRFVSAPAARPAIAPAAIAGLGATRRAPASARTPVRRCRHPKQVALRLPTARLGYSPQLSLQQALP